MLEKRAKGSLPFLRTAWRSRLRQGQR